MNETLQDSQLIQRYLAGDKTSFDALTMRYLKLVYSVVLHYVKDVGDAEDLAQDVFIKVMKHLKRFDLEKPFKPWVLQIARNQALDWIKKKKPVLLSDMETTDDVSLLDLIPDPMPPADAIAQQRQTAAELSSAVRELSATERHVLFFHYIRGFTFKEIADELHEIIDTVKSRHRRALGKLRKMLAESSLGTK